MIAALISTLVAGGVFTAWTVWTADRQMRADALHQTALLARTIEVDDVKALTSTAKDLGTPAYLRVKEQLAVLRTTVPNSRFLYLLGRHEGEKLFYYADSEPVGSKDESPAGEEYSAGQTPEEDFSQSSEMTTGPIQDRWGTWMSAFVPLRDPITDFPVAFLGMDVDAGQWRRTMLRVGIIPMVFTVLLLVVILVGHAFSTRCLLWIPPQYKGVKTALEVAVIGLVLTLAVSWIFREQERRRYRDDFSQLADSQFASMTKAFQTLSHVELEGLTHFFSGSEEVTPAEFSQYTEYLVKNPYIQAWEWIPAIPESDKENHEAAMRAAGDPSFMVWQKEAGGTRVPAEKKSVYYPISYVEPRCGNERAVGYDPSTSPELKDTLERASLAGMPKISPPVTLVQERGFQKGAVVYAPVFLKTQPGKLRGYVAAVLRMGKFLDGTMGMYQRGKHHLSYCEIYQWNSGREPELMASTAPESMPEGYSVMRFHMAFGRLYAVKIFPGSAFRAMHARHSVWIAVLAGLLLTGVISVLVGVVENRRYYLEWMVAKRTALLHESDENFRRLFQHNPLALALSSVQDRRFTDVNEAFLNTLGFSRDEVIGKTVADLHLICEMDKFTQAVGRLKEQGHIDDLELKIRRKDGVILYGLFSGEIVRMSHSDYYLTVMIDNTARKRAEAERLRLATAIEQSAETIIITDSAGIIQYANPAFAALTGFTCREAVGQTPELLRSGKHDGAFYRDMWSCIQSGKTWQGRFVNKKKDGSLFTEEASISPVKDEAGDIVNYVAVKRDITNEIKLERQFLQAQKMEVVGRLAGGVAHDFNNMLGVILGYTEMALAKVDASLPLHADLLEVQASALRTADLTRQLLAFARKQTVLPRMLDLNGVVESSVNMLRRLIGEHITLEWRPKDSLWPVRLDPSQVDQILSNLCVNARDAITGNGRITIEMDMVALDDTYCLSHEGAYPGDYVMMTFTDTGCGMAADVLSHIFEPFYTTKGVGEGTGLGLATVYGIVKQNHGFITAQSKPGSGTSFQIYFPRQLGLAPQVERSNGAEALKGGKETILLVEDDKAVLDMTRHMLQTLGYEVVATTSPDEAMQAARDGASEFHLMLIDVLMPEMNGPELARQIHIFRPTLMCLFMSSYPSSVAINHGLTASAHFIQKPFSIAVLASVIRKLLEHG